MSALRVFPISFDRACAFVAQHHRHHQPPQGHKFSLCVAADDTVHGVAIVGRPVARAYDDGLTLEVTRLATDGTRNSCSALYGAAWRSAREQGYRRMITYTQGGESGASLRAVGWIPARRLAPRMGWTTPSRPRRDRGTDGIERFRWEITTHDAPTLVPPRNETGNETRGMTRRLRCPICRARFTPAATGRPPKYCSTTCRVQAHRHRARTPQPSTDGPGTTA